MAEDWRRLEEFPAYAVSDLGRVMNTNTELIKVPTINQQGIPSVLLMRDRVQYRRSVAKLVIQEFILRPVRHFDTPINRDGNRNNNHVSNLEWRPRWFAAKYHIQFHPAYRPRFDRPIVDVETGRMYNNSMEAAMTHGLLDSEIFLATVNNTIVFPTNQRFRLVE